MAEVINLPPRFSKKWWSYFWDYYKWYVIGFICIVFAIIITVVQVKNRPQYQFKMVYAGSGYFSEEQIDLISERLIQKSDEENDGVFFSQMNFDSSAMSDIQYESALYEKMELQLITDETMLFLFDEESLKKYTENTNYGDIWTKSSDWAGDIPDELKKGEYGVSLNDSGMLKELNIDGSNIYVAVRNNYSPDNKDASTRYKFSLNAAKMLVAN